VIERVGASLMFSPPGKKILNAGVTSTSGHVTTLALWTAMKLIGTTDGIWEWTASILSPTDWTAGLIPGAAAPSRTFVVILQDLLGFKLER